LAKRKSESLTVLIFSLNDVEKTLKLIEHVYDIADEIILVDSSSRSAISSLEASKRNLGLKKLSIFYAIALGYPDPLREYGLLKCSGSWVLLIDTDERLSDALKSDISTIINGANENAFGIKRYEDVKNGEIGTFFTWQVRLFRRSSVTYKGLLHEQAEVQGTLGRLADKYFMIHQSELMHHQLTEYRGYKEIRKYERFSYQMYNERFMTDVGKYRLSKDGEVNKTLSGRLTYGWLRFYETITFRKMDAEISNFDYFFYFFVRDLVFALKERSAKKVLMLTPDGLKYLKVVKYWKSQSDSAESFEISKIINRIGIIKFLGLDREKVVDGLNRKYRDKPQGIQLLISLLKEKYNSQIKRSGK
jgi:hypothetical protein